MKSFWKKGFCLLLCLVMLAGLFPTALAEGELCTVYFVSNGGQYTEPITAEAGSEISLPLPRWRGHAFLGWALEDGGEAAYQAGESLVLTETMNLYALWRQSRSLGLQAYPVGSMSNNLTIRVPKGSSAELAVNASVYEGGLSYEWECNNTDCAQLPTKEENLSSWTLRNVDTFYDISCAVWDDEGNVVYIYFFVGPDTGLWARAEGDDQYVERCVQKGENVTLTVEAGVEEGGLHFHWFSGDLDPSLLPEDDQTRSVTINNVDRYFWITCRVEDDYGNFEDVTFEISTDLGLEVYAAGTKSQYKRCTVQRGENVILAVDARVNEGSLRYVWECYDGLDPSLLPADDSTSSFTLFNVDHSHQIYCYVYDQENNYKFVHFDIHTDLGLKAYVAGTKEQYAEYSVDLGGSVPLAVDAEVAEGGLRYYWFAEDGSPEGLPTDDKTSSFTVKNVQQRYQIHCEVVDDDNNSEVVGFTVYPKTGLEAWIVGTSSNYKRYSVEYGGSVPLAVEGKTNAGQLHYRWICEEGDPSVLPKDDKTSSFTIDNVDRRYSIRCDVTDDLGVLISLYMEIDINNALKAVAAGTETSQIFFFENTAPQTLAVEASARVGELSYQWMVSEKDRIYYYDDLPDANSASLEVDAIDRVCNYRCEVTDIYGSSQYVTFCFRPGMLQEIFLGQEAELESDPDLGEIFVCFTPEVTGYYSLKSAEGDPNAWILLPGRDYYEDLPCQIFLEEGITYPFIISSQQYDFSLHLTIQNSGFTSFEELKALLASSKEGDRLSYSGSDESFTIPENLVIPSGRSVMMNSTGVTVAAGAKLTLEEDSELYCGDVTILGAVENGGVLDCYSITGRDKIHQGETGLVIFTILVQDKEKLYTALDTAAADQDTQVFYEINVMQDLTIDKDLCVPAYTIIYSSRTVTLAPGVTLEISDGENSMLYLYGNGHLRVQGTLRNQGVVRLFGSETLILEEGGVYTGDGEIRAYSWYGSENEYFPWLSLPEYSGYMVSTENDEYILRKRPPLVAGDVTWDGSINTRDLLCLRKHLIGLKPEQAVLAPDVNGDGAVNILDLVRLRKILAANALAQN